MDISNIREQRTRTELETVLGEGFWPYLDDDAVREVDMRPSGNVVIIKNGERIALEPAELSVDVQDAERIGRAILAASPYPPQVNEDNPAATVKMLLSDMKSFARVHVSGPPLTPAFQVCIRKHYAEAPEIERGWLQPKYMTEEQFAVLKHAAAEHWNIMFLGAMGSGKTTLKNTYTNHIYVPMHPGRAFAEIMDVPETLCNARDFVPLYYSKKLPASRAAEEVLRMNVDVVGINEARSAEAYELFYNIWISDHNGCSGTAHGADALSGLWRCETMIAQSPYISERGVDRRIVAQALDLVVTLRKTPHGRRIVEMVHVKGANGSTGEYELEHLVKPTVQVQAA